MAVIGTVTIGTIGGIAMFGSTVIGTIGATRATVLGTILTGIRVGTALIIRLTMVTAVGTLGTTLVITTAVGVGIEAIGGTILTNRVKHGLIHPL